MTELVVVVACMFLGIYCTGETFEGYLTLSLGVNAGLWLAISTLKLGEYE